MVFSSSIFIFLFLPLTIGIYYLLKGKIRNYILLIASLIFYACGGIKYLPVLLLSILINYIFGILVDRYKDNKIKGRVLLTIGVLLNLGILFYFKYFDFAIGNINSIFKLDISLRYIALPIGISFFTFQGMSYIIDIYRGDGEVNKNLFSVALYISLFAQLVAGPIVKYKDISNQIELRKESIAGFSYGIERFVVGLAKKVILADVLGEISANIFSQAYIGLDVPTAWLGIICYTLQIFFDFSGYSDMAIGIGHFFGFKFLENFNYPYISKSITEFWRRWHISLSTWFREYVYIPLGGNRTGHTYRNLIIVFFITGLWHGASWNFIIWGMWHGVFIVVERLIRKKEWYINAPNCFKWGITMFVVLIGWVFFSASSFREAIYYLSIMFGKVSFNDIVFKFNYFFTFRVIVWVVVAILLSTPIFTCFKKFEGNKKYEIIKTIGLGFLLILTIIFIINSSYSPFIYFQF